MPKGKLYKRKRNMRRSKKKIVKRSGKPTRQFAVAVKKVIHRLAENKVRQAEGKWGVRYMSDSNTDLMVQSNLVPLSPYPQVGLAVDECLAISQGTGSSSRIGNQIQTRRAIFRGVFTPNKYDPANNPVPLPMEILLIIFKLKGVGPTGSFGDDLDGARHMLNNHLYQANYGSGQSSKGIDGQLLSLTREFNKDAVNILYKRVFKLGVANIQTSLDGDRASNQSYANNDFKYNCKFTIDCTKYLLKTYKYNDNDTETSNSNTYAFWCPFNASGFNTNNNGLFPCTLNWNLTYEFEDI